MRVAKQLAAINKQIEKLEALGFNCHMIHIHDVLFNKPGTDLYADHVTVFTIADEDHIGEVDSEWVGVAMCSIHDQFSPVTGAQIAFSRAVRAMSKELGRAEMKYYFSE